MLSGRRVALETGGHDGNNTILLVLKIYERITPQTLISKRSTLLVSAI